MFLPGTLFGINAAHLRRYARRGSMAAFAAALFAGRTALAQEVWIGESNGLWSAGANWLDGTAPAVGGDAALALRFTNAITATDDLAGAFALGRIIFDTNASTGVSIVGNAGSTLRFTGANPGIELRGVGDATLTLPLQLDATSGGLTISASGPGQLNLSGTISQGAFAQPLTIDTGATSPNVSVVQLSGTQTFSGGVVLQSGNLAVASASALGTGALTVRGGTFSFASAGLVVANPIVLQSDLTIQVAAGSSTFGNLSGVISSATPGTGLIVRTAGDTVRLSAASTYTGATTVDYSRAPQSATLAGGILSLTGTTGSLLQTSAFHIRAGSTLQLNGSASTDNRVADTTPIHLRGGGLLYLATTPGGTQQTETAGPVDGAGYSPITSSATTGIGTRLNLQSLTRTERGTFLFRGTGLGGTPGVGVGSIFVNAAPVLVGGGGTGPAISILPYAVGDTSATGTGVGFVTYGATTGLRPLNNTTEYRATLASAAANENVRLIAAETLNAARTVNALLLDAGSVNGTGTLTVASGAIFQRSGSGVAVPLNFGNVEPNIFTAAELTLSGTVAGTNGLTKSGAGRLTLTAANSFTGPLTINAGTIAFSARVALGGADSAIVINGHGAGLNYIGAGAIAFSRPIETRNGLALLSAGGTGDFQITAPIAGAGGLQISASAGLTIALPAGSTYAGTTHLGSGRLLIPGDSALGAGGALNLAGGTLALAGNWSTAREINLVSATLDTAGFDAAWTGAVTGAGTLTKTGAGELRLAVPSRFRGTVTVQGGSFALSDGGALAANVTVASGAELRIDHSATVAANRLGDNATVTLTGGAFSLVGNAGTPVTERIGSLLFAAGGRTDQTLSLIAPGAAGVTLRLGSGLTLGNGDLVVRAPQLGDRERLVVGNAGALGGGVIPGVYADPALAGAGSSFVVYDATADAAGIIGVRPLRAAEYATAAVLQNPATPANASFLADAAVTAVGANNTIDNLTLAGGGSVALGAGQTLAITSGEVLARAGTSAISGGTLSFGTRRADFYTAGELTLGSSVTGTAGLKKSGPGTLIFAGSAGYSGGTLITGGVLRPAGGDPFSADTVTVNAPGVFDGGAGSFSIGALNGAGGVTLGGGTLTLGTSGTAFAFSGAFSGSGQIVIVDGANPLADRTFSGSSTFTGNAVLNSGRLRLGSAGALGTGSLIVNGGSLRASTALTLAPALVLNADLPILGTSALTLGPGASATGAKDLVLRSTAALNITGAFSLTGKLRAQFGPDDEFALTPGTITVQGAAGGITTAAGVRIESGGRLVLSEATAYTGGGEGRLGNATPVHLGAGTLQYTANGTVNSSEVFGVLTSAGFSTVSLTPTATTSAVLTATSLGRVERGTFSFGSTTGTLGAAFAPNVAQFFASAAPALIGGGGTGANTSIIPWAVGTSGTGAAFVTYGANGVRLLTAAESVTSLTASTATSNVQLSGSFTNTAVRTINALSLGAITLSGTPAISITSGAVLFTGTSAGPISTPLNFASAEAQFFFPLSTASTLTVSSTISGTGGLTRSGFGALTLAGTNDFTGPITINGGVLNFSTPANLGAGTDAITLHGHDASLTFTGANAVTVARPLHLGGGISRLTTAQSTGVAEYAGAIDGPGGLRVVGTGTVVLSGANTFTGPAFVEANVAIASDAALGAGGGVFFSADGVTLGLNGDWTTARRIELGGTTTINTNGHEALVQTPLLTPGNGRLVKTGAGTLRLSNGLSQPIEVTVTGGALQLEQSASFPSSHYTLSGGGALVLDNRALAMGDRIPNNATMTMNGGEIRLIGNATSPVNEQVGGVSLGANTSNILTVAAAGTAPVTLTLAGFAQGSGDVLFRGDQLGGAAGGRIVFATAPSLIGGVIPGALADASATGSGSSLAFYDTSSDAAGTIGVRALTAADYTTGAEIRNPLNGGATPVTANFFTSGPTTAGGAINRLNTLRLGGAAGVALGSGQVLSLDAASVLVDAGAHAAIAGGALNFPNSPAYLVTLGDLAIGSRISGATVFKTGAGTLTLEGATKFSGTLNLNGGAVQVTAGDALRFATANVSAGTTLRFSQMPASVGTITGAGAIDLPAAGMLTVQYFSGSTTVGGQGGLKITSNAGFAAPLTFSGPLIATAENPYPSFNPNVYFNGDASALAASSIFIGAGARLSLDNAARVLARLGTVPVEISGGMLSLAGGLGGSVVENLGALSVRGLATFKVETAFGGSTGAALSFASFTRNDRATLRFESAGTLGGLAKVQFPAGLAANLVGAGTTATNVPILPFASGFDSAIGTVPVTFSASTGIRRLTGGELSATLTAGDNVHIRSNPGPTNNGAVTVNSLVTLRDILGTGTITVTSGFFGANGAGKIENGLSFGSAEANFVIDQSSLTLLGALNGSGGLTKSGTGTIVLPAVNNISGPLTINAGALSFATPSQLGTDSGAIVMHSGGVLWSGTGDLVLPRAIRLNGGFGVLGTTGSTGTLHVAQPVTGPGGLNITGRAIFDTPVAYTGATMISGTLTLGSDALLGASPQVRFNNGTLVLAGPWNTSREVLVPTTGITSGTLNTAGFDAVLSGPLTGSGVLVKTGAGRASIADVAGFSGRISIAEGAIVFDNTDPLNGGRLNSNGRLELAGGVLELLGNPLVPVVERISTLSLGSSTLSSIRMTALGTTGHILNVETFLRGTGALVVVQADALGGGPGGAFTRIVQTTLAPASGSFVGGLIVADTNGAPLGLGVYDGAVDAAGPIGVRAARAEEYATGATIQNPANGGSTPTTANFLVGTATTAVGSSNTVSTIGINAGANLKIPASSQLTVSGTVVFTKVGPGGASIEGGALRFSNGAVFLTGGDLEVKSPISNSGSGSNTFHKLGPAVLNLRGNVTGFPAYIEEGTVRLGKPDALSQLSVTISPGATLDTASGSATVGRLSGSGAINLGAGGILRMKGASDFSGTTRGSGTLSVFQEAFFSAATLTPSGTLSHAGPILIDGGSLVLQGAGKLSGATSVRAANYGTLSVLSTTGLSASTPLDLEQGTLDLQPGNAALQLGPLTGYGFGKIAVKHDVAALQVDFASINRGPEGAAVFYLNADSTNLGAAPGPVVANVRFGPGFESNLAGGPGVTPVIPFLSASVPPRSYHDHRLVTYSAANGARLLTDAEYSPLPVTGSNYRFPDFTTLDDVVTVNSLSNIGDPSLLFGYGSVNITGGIALLSNATVLVPVDFGARQGNIIAPIGSYARFGAPIGGSGGLTLSGGEIDLGSGNSFTGPLVINGGFIRFNDLSAFGPDTSPITIYGSTLQQESGTLVFHRALHLAGGVVTFQSNGGNDFHFPTPISGPGGLSLQYSNSMSITGANSYRGPTTIHANLTINGDSAFGQSSQINLEYGSITVTNSWITGKPVRTTTTFTLDTNGFDISLLGPLSSENALPLTKRGLGRLTITDASECTGSLEVIGGSLELRGNLAGNVTGDPGTTITGDGSVSGTITVGGILDPGFGTGEFSAGTVQLQTNATLHLLLDSAALFDRIVSRNAPSLGSNITLDLQLAPGFDPIDDFDTFILIRNDSSNPISKAVASPLVFAGNALDEGEVFYAGGQAWLFSYTGGTGNDVTIHAVPEPSIVATIAAGLAMLGSRRRRATR